MRLRYKSTLFILFILILGCLALGVTYHIYMGYFYEKALVIADEALTINYQNGNDFSNKKNKTLKFMVTNNSTEEESFYIKLANVYASKEKYTLKGIDDDLNISNDLISSIVVSEVKIAANTTLAYELEITSGKESYHGEIIVAKGSKDSSTFADIIKDNSNILDNPTTSFKEIASSNEGLIKNETEDGIVYYYRGNITNNYVTFADNLWRIVKINEDGSVKIVLNNLIEGNSSYASGDKYEFDGSQIQSSLNDWYTVYLKSYSSKIANHNFCNDLVIDEGSEYYAAYNRLNKNYIPNNSCLGTVVTTNIGLLSADEVVMAGASTDDNKEYYLYNEDIKTDYYTMTSAKKTSSGYFPYIVEVNGALSFNTNANQSKGIRPVINIIKNISATGNGTKENPYVLLDI